MTSRRRRFAERIFTILLHLYPRWFQKRYRTEQTQMFREWLDREAPAEFRPWQRWYVECCWKTVAAACGARRDRHVRLTAKRGVIGSASTGRRSLASGLWFDVCDGWRSLAAAPVVTSVALLSLALGIGSNTAVFSLLNSLTLKTLPVRAPEQLVMISGRTWTNPIWEEVRERQDILFDGAFAWSSNSFDLSRGGETDFVNGLWLSGRAFEVLGVPAILGRTFGPEDDARGGGPGGPVAVISYGFWHRRFGGRADVVGQSLSIQRVPFTIVGVTPSEFFGPTVGYAFDVAIPIGTESLIAGEESHLDQRSSWWLYIMARLDPNQTVDAAAAALQIVLPQILEATIPPEWSPELQERYLALRLTVTSAARGLSRLRGQYQKPLVAIMVVTALMLLIACANIANLLLARATARRREFSLRLALGASRTRLFRQLGAESLLLASVGAGLGLVLANWASGYLVAQLVTGGESAFLDLSLDWRILAFTTVATGITAVLFGLAPALGSTRVAPAEALKEQGRSGAGDRGLRLRHALVVAQVALSLTLVVAAGLFIQTFASLASVPLGFDPERVLVTDVNVQTSQVAADRRAQLYERLRAAVASLPGVSHVAASVVTPVSGEIQNTIVDVPEGAELPESQRIPMVNYVTPEWFATYGMRLRRGRDIDTADRRGAEPVAVVNQAFARRFFDGADPLGQVVRERLAGDRFESFRIVGLVEDSVYSSLRAESPPTMYFALAQYPGPLSSISLSVRSPNTSPPILSARVVDVVSSVDPNLALTFRPMADRVASAMTQERLVAMLSTFFGGLAVLLAALGLYGVTSYAVSRRRAEIGIRLALGANRASVVRLVLRRVSRLVTIGTLLGIAVSLWASQFIESLLFGLAPRDPTTLIAAAGTLVGVGLLSGLLPARRASRVDPARVLRDA